MSRRNWLLLSVSSDTRDNCHAALHSEYHNQSLSQILCYILHLHSVSEITWRMNISESTLKRPPSLCLQPSYLRAIDNIYPKPVQAHDTVTRWEQDMRRAHKSQVEHCHRGGSTRGWHSTLWHVCSPDNWHCVTGFYPGQALSSVSLTADTPHTISHIEHTGADKKSRHISVIVEFSPLPSSYWDTAI